MSAKHTAGPWAVETTVLLAIDGDVWMGWHEDGRWWHSDAMPLGGVTHWAQMPEVPT